MSRRAEFEASHPDIHILSADQAGRVDLVMGALGWLGEEEQVTTCTPLPGESSTVMRVELRELRGGWRTAVLKQALPWLPSDESVAMPADRGGAELRFYRRVAGLSAVAPSMPRLLGGDETRSVLLLEDFRGASDLTSLYRQGSLGVAAADALGSYLQALHGGTRGAEEPAPASSRTGMKRLNHRLLFEAPFFSSSAEGVDFGADGPGRDPAALEAVEPGLGDAAAALRTDGAFREALGALGRQFLDGGACLVHGAFHPGNWLSLPGGDVRVVDPQFGGPGDAEFDIGAGLAHLLLARQPEEVVDAFLAAAAGPQEEAGPAPAADGGEGERQAVRAAASASSTAGRGRLSPHLRMELVAGYAGAELIRRLIGGGRLPLAGAAGSCRYLLEAARTAVVDGRLEVLET